MYNHNKAQQGKNRVHISGIYCRQYVIIRNFPRESLSQTVVCSVFSNQRLVIQAVYPMKHYVVVHFPKISKTKQIHATGSMQRLLMPWPFIYTGYGIRTTSLHIVMLQLCISIKVYHYPHWQFLNSVYIFYTSCTNDFVMEAFVRCQASMNNTSG